MEVRDIEVWVLVDQDGDYAVGKDEDNLKEQWDNDIGGTAFGSKKIKISLKIEMPPAVEITAEVPAKEGKIVMTVSG